MTELKTLKDFGVYPDERDLKAEATKYLDTDKVLVGSEVREWIKYFFNLTPEDLK